MNNYYKFLCLPPTAGLTEIQNQLKLAAQSGKVPIEILHEIRDTLYNSEKRRAYDAALRQADPAFFQPQPKAPAQAANRQPAQSQAQPPQRSAQQRPAQNPAPRQPQKQAQSARRAPAPSNRAPLLSTRNIVLALCALAVLTWLLPWANTPLKSYLGASLNFRLLAWVNTIIFAATAAKVWLDDKQEKPTAYTELMLAALFALLIHAQYYLRLKPYFERLGTPHEVLSYGIGLYAQIIVTLLMLGYVLFAKKLDQ
ncbi:hypothetical protein [Kingella oralis]|uniref:hypothetical protein n=1 Tax=Kingella oralis TaxID=505 RepID=UPI002D7FDC02|nr:hypothetical protein [Kingella oralis]